jgi:hypothetical protein
MDRPLYKSLVVAFFATAARILKAVIIIAVSQSLPQSCALSIADLTSTDDGNNHDGSSQFGIVGLEACPAVPANLLTFRCVSDVQAAAHTL